MELYNNENVFLAIKSNNELYEVIGVTNELVCRNKNIENIDLEWYEINDETNNSDNTPSRKGFEFFNVCFDKVSKDVYDNLESMFKDNHFHYSDRTFIREECLLVAGNKALDLGSCSLDMKMGTIIQVEVTSNVYKRSIEYTNSDNSMLRIV